MSLDRAHRISRHFVLGDLLVDASFPDLAADLAPGEEELQNLERLSGVLDRLCDKFPPGFMVRSGYRNPRLNEACRHAGFPASLQSLHLSGCAADIEARDPELDLELVYEWVREQVRSDLPVHEAVFYPIKGFIHVAVEDRATPTAKRLLMRT